MYIQHSGLKRGRQLGLISHLDSFDMKKSHFDSAIPSLSLSLSHHTHTHTHTQAQTHMHILKETVDVVSANRHCAVR